MAEPVIIILFIVGPFRDTSITVPSNVFEAVVLVVI